MTKTIGKVGFIYKDKIIKPTAKLNGLDIINDNEVIKLTETELNKLIEEGYIVTPVKPKPLAKFAIGDMVKLKQTSVQGEMGSLINSNAGFIHARHYKESENKWSYAIKGLTIEGSREKGVSVNTIIEGRLNDFIDEKNLETTSTLENIVDFPGLEELMIITITKRQ